MLAVVGVTITVHSQHFMHQTLSKPISACAQWDNLGGLFSNFLFVGGISKVWRGIGKGM